MDKSLQGILFKFYVNHPIQYAAHVVSKESLNVSLMDCRWLAYPDDKLFNQSAVGIIRRESQIDVALVDVFACSKIYAVTSWRETL